MNTYNTYNTGDKVRFMNDVGEGVVTQVLTHGQVMVLVDGLEIPYMCSELVAASKIFSSAGEDTASVAEERRSQDDTAVVATAEERIPQDTVAIAAAAEDSAEAKETFPDREGSRYRVSAAFMRPHNSQTKLYLLNEGSYQMYYSIGFCKTGGQVTPIANGHLEAEGRVFVAALDLCDLMDNKTLRVDVLPFKNIEFQPTGVRYAMQPLGNINIRRDSAFRRLPFFDEEVLTVMLLSDDIAAVGAPLPQETKRNCGGAAVSAAVMPVKTIDLRQAVLRLELGFAGDSDLQRLQVGRAKAGVEALLRNECSKCVLVYGIGAQQTKNELSAMLAADYPQLQAQDASQKEYHYGAIAVVNAPNAADNAGAFDNKIQTAGRSIAASIEGEESPGKAEQHAT